MEIDFIVTCFNREDYWPPLSQIMGRYAKIQARTALVYTGQRDDFPCSVRCLNLGEKLGDFSSTMLGYAWLCATHPEHRPRRIVKIGVDSWLCDEDKIIGIFEAIERNGCGYAGNRWHTETDETLATDIIFADLKFGNVFQHIAVPAVDFERRMFLACRDNGIKVYNIPERVPVHPTNRFECPALKWTMHHELERNLSNLMKWGK